MSVTWSIVIPEPAPAGSTLGQVAVDCTVKLMECRCHGASDAIGWASAGFPIELARSPVARCAAA